MHAKSLIVGALAAVLALSGCAAPSGSDGAEPVSVAGAEQFVERAEAELLELWIAAGRAAWVRENFITEDTQALEATATAAMMARTAELAQESTRFDGLELPADVERKIRQLKTSLALIAPGDAADQQELSEIATRLGSMYGSGEYCEGEVCQSLTELSNTLAGSRDADALLRAWQGWRSVSPAMRPLYERFVELGNAGARELGFVDLGEMWRSGYDMPADDFAVEIDRLWEQVKPLYDQLHCHVRAKLAEHYGEELVPLDQPIPAHLLGNMWSAGAGAPSTTPWLPAAPANADPGYDLDKLLKREARTTPIKHGEDFGEAFFSSLGFEPLPRDLLGALALRQAGRPRRRLPRERLGPRLQGRHPHQDVHQGRRARTSSPSITSSATTTTSAPTRTSRRSTPTGANDGFHEAVGDTDRAVDHAGLSGRSSACSSPTPCGKATADLGLLMTPDGVGQGRFPALRSAHRPVALEVCSRARSKPARATTQAWWDLQDQVPGHSRRRSRSHARHDFDPGAKYHIPGNTPYTRYFLAHILQFQFHRALCEAAGNTEPLHHCSIYGNADAGAKLNAMLEMGASRPWPEALEAIAGSPEMDATAIIDYFAPLMEWLEAENAGRECGWS